MNYKLDDIPITNYGAQPALSGQYYALHGMLDLPKRLGTTEHNWGTTIEPFVSAEDIKLDGRTLTLHAVVNSSSHEVFIQACIDCRELSTDYDTFEVYCKDEIKIVPISVDKYLVTVPFWQEKYVLVPTPSNPSGSGAFRLDNFDLRKDFGIYVGESADLLNTARRIDIQTTDFYERTNLRGTKDIVLSCSMMGYSFGGVHDSMLRFQSLLMTPGMRTLATPKKTLSLYFKDGIVVNIVRPNILQFTLKGISL